MKIQIPKITLDAFEIWGNEAQEKELDRQENAVKSVWMSIYEAIASGGSNIAYWDECHVTRPEYNSFMRYALHRSPKKDGFLQLSVMEIQDGEIIPTSDSQHDSVEDFINRRAWGCSADFVTVM